jgi:hypothetical protein
MASLPFVLVATVQGSEGSRVLLISGSCAPKIIDVGDDSAIFIRPWVSPWGHEMLI